MSSACFDVCTERDSGYAQPRTPHIFVSKAGVTAKPFARILGAPDHAGDCTSSGKLYIPQAATRITNMRLSSLIRLSSAAALLLVAAYAGRSAIAAEDAVTIPPPALDKVTSEGTQTAVLAGGCFWGVQGVFQHTKGVISAVSGYTGGVKETADYERVGGGRTGHAESVQIKFDPTQISYGKLLQIFFSVVHNPTELNFQGPDQGPSYRSVIFAMTDAQKKVAAAYIAQLDAAKVFRTKIVTEVTPYTNFYQAEDYHQDAATTVNINPGYITAMDLPKIANLKAMFPEVWREKPRLVFASNAS
jgi:peptide-methionine (S)-S-oxide reductase